MAIQQQINHGTIQKVCYLHNGIFIPFTCVTLCQIYSFVSPILFTKNNKLWNEIKEGFFCLYGHFRVLLSIKEGGKPHLI